MKHICIFVLCLLSFSELKAQSFGETGTEWYYDYSGEVAPNSEYQYLKSVKDTQMKGKTVHRIDFTFHYDKRKITQGQPEFVYQSGDTVFVYRRNRFLKLMVYNLQIGDTVRYDFYNPSEVKSTRDSAFLFVLNRVDTVVIKGVALKRYKGSIVWNNIAWNQGVYTERLGWDRWFFPEYQPSTPTSGGMRCFHQGNVDTNFRKFACDYWISTSVDQHWTEKQLSAWPNPVADLLHVPISEGCFWSIYNASGQLVLNGQYEGNIDCSQLSNGVYHLYVTDAFKSREVTFVKQ